ncbi:MAG: L,D-transpeptidase family protein, partial [Actinomycetota bacterium]|nr:L,D-transpeptidase family protein [Actinomycetota bacterium]
ATVAALVAAVAIAFGTGVDLDEIDETSGNRLELVEGGLSMVADRPLWGFGSGSFAERFRDREEASSRRAASASHTIPITIAAEQGVIGLASYLVVLAAAFLLLFPTATADAYRTREKPTTSPGFDGQWRKAPPGPPVPAGSGTGRRVVYSVSQQRVWLVDGPRVDRNYAVSGRRNFPRPGTYRVFSTSRHSRNGAVRMEYMVRFTRGPRWAVGFHSIPVRGDGRPIQSEAELGSFRSSGCVRQSLADAAYLWNWAPVGTVVVVTP